MTWTFETNLVQLSLESKDLVLYQLIRGELLTQNLPFSQILGFEQEDWFNKELLKSKESGNRWRLVGNQIKFSSLAEFTNLPFFGDVKSC